MANLPVVSSNAGLSYRFPVWDNNLYYPRNSIILFDLRDALGEGISDSDSDLITTLTNNGNDAAFFMFVANEDVDANSGSPFALGTWDPIPGALRQFTDIAASVTSIDDVDENLEAGAFSLTSGRRGKSVLIKAIKPGAGLRLIDSDGYVTVELTGSADSDSILSTIIKNTLSNLDSDAIVDTLVKNTLNNLDSDRISETVLKITVANLDSDAIMQTVNKQTFADSDSIVASATKVIDSDYIMLTVNKQTFADSDSIVASSTKVIDSDYIYEIVNGPYIRSHTLDSDQVLGLIDSEYVQSLVDSEFVREIVDSDFLAAVVSDPLQLRLDSDRVDRIHGDSDLGIRIDGIDSEFIQSRQLTFADSDHVENIDRIFSTDSEDAIVPHRAVSLAIGDLVFDWDGQLWRRTAPLTLNAGETINFSTSEWSRTGFHYELDSEWVLSVANPQVDSDWVLSVANPQVDSDWVLNSINVDSDFVINRDSDLAKQVVEHGIRTVAQLQDVSIHENLEVSGTVQNLIQNNFQDFDYNNYFKTAELALTGLNDSDAADARRFFAHGHRIGINQDSDSATPAVTLQVSNVYGFGLRGSARSAGEVNFTLVNDSESNYLETRATIQNGQYGYEDIPSTIFNTTFIVSSNDGDFFLRFDRTTNRFVEQPSTDVLNNPVDSDWVLSVANPQVDSDYVLSVSNPQVDSDWVLSSTLDSDEVTNVVNESGSIITLQDGNVAPFDSDGGAPSIADFNGKLFFGVFV